MESGFQLNLSGAAIFEDNCSSLLSSGDLGRNSGWYSWGETGWKQNRAPFHVDCASFHLYQGWGSPLHRKDHEEHCRHHRPLQPFPPRLAHSVSLSCVSQFSPTAPEHLRKWSERKKGLFGLLAQPVVSYSLISGSVLSQNIMAEQSHSADSGQRQNERGMQQRGGEEQERGTWHRPHSPPQATSRVSIISDGIKCDLVSGFLLHDQIAFQKPTSEHCDSGNQASYILTFWGWQSRCWS